MVAVPGSTPVTTPVVPSTEAMPGALLLHTPPVTVLDSEMVRPVHTLVDPLMVPAVGAAFIVAILVVKQPVVAAV